MSEARPVSFPILLVEDEEDHARLIMRVLTKRIGVSNPIHWVKNGIEALAYLQPNSRDAQHSPRPALVLLDMKLPMMSGFEVLKRLQDDERCRTIPAVMLTTSANAEDRAKAFELGAKDYLTKSVNFADFIASIRRLVHDFGLLEAANAESSAREWSGA